MGEEKNLFEFGFKKSNSSEENLDTKKQNILKSENNRNLTSLQSSGHEESLKLTELHRSNASISKCSEKCERCNLISFLDIRWQNFLIDEFKKKYMIEIIEYLHNEKTFYPKMEQVFEFSKYFDPKETKVVIIGQDPYHNPNQAMGLAFSVPFNSEIPPSLRNIYKELKDNYESFNIPNHGNLTEWAAQGVLLLNSSLTVRKNSPNSHSNIGWQKFTDYIISYLSRNTKNLVFILWGSYAQKKSVLIDSKKHLVLKSSHPSPFSAERGFFGCKHFLKANSYLKKNLIKAINWDIEPRKQCF